VSTIFLLLCYLKINYLLQERDAVKKLDNVRKDHDLRLKALSETQEHDRHKAELITRNHEMVDHAIRVVRSALAKQVCEIINCYRGSNLKSPHLQMSWPDVARMVQEAKAQKDPVATSIISLKLEVNNITMRLWYGAIIN
jgi:predicted ribosome quality control (RQC) complex YloA/Tae2 family protein